MFFDGPDSSSLQREAVVEEPLLGTVTGAVEECSDGFEDAAVQFVFKGAARGVELLWKDAVSDLGRRVMYGRWCM